MDATFPGDLSLTAWSPSLPGRNGSPWYNPEDLDANPVMDDLGRGHHHPRGEKPASRSIRTLFLTGPFHGTGERKNPPSMKDTQRFVTVPRGIVTQYIDQFRKKDLTVTNTEYVKERRQRLRSQRSRATAATIGSLPLLPEALIGMPPISSMVRMFVEVSSY